MFDTVKSGKLNRAHFAEPYVSQIKVGKCIVPIRRRLSFFYPDTGQFQSLTVRTIGDCLRFFLTSYIMKQYFYLLVFSLLWCSCDNVSGITGDVAKKASSLYDEYLGDKETSVSFDSIKKSNSPIKFSTNARASKLMDERRIYLVDLTRSMEGYNGAEDIFDKVKEQMNSAISTMNDTTSEIVIVPFTDKLHELYIDKIANKKSIVDYIANLKTRPGDTNILDAWRKGASVLDSTKINYMFMLTDGVHNTGEPIDSLYSTLSNWHSKTQGKYQFAFYVLLSPSAKEQEICRIVDSSKQMWLVPSMNIQTDFIVGNMNQSVNIIDNKRIKMHLTCTNPEIFNHGFRFRISLPKNEYYQIINASEAIDKNGDVFFEIKKLKSQEDLPISYRTKILIEYDRIKFPFVFFTPEEYNLNIVNVGTRIMNIKQLER